MGRAEKSTLQEVDAPRGLLRVLEMRSPTLCETVRVGTRPTQQRKVRINLGFGIQSQIPDFLGTEDRRSNPQIPNPTIPEQPMDVRILGSTRCTGVSKRIGHNFAWNWGRDTPRGSVKIILP